MHDDDITKKLRDDHEANPSEETAAVLAVHLLLKQSAEHARETGEGADWWARLGGGGSC